MDKHSNQNNNTPFIAIEGDVIQEVNEAFIELSGFSKEELLGKSLSYVWYDLLRIITNPYSLDKEQEVYLFTKFLEPRRVKIQANVSSTIYNIYEVPGSKFEDRNVYVEQLFNSEVAGIAVYSVPDLILLKANQKYLGFFDYPFNKIYNSVGKRIWEIFAKWKDSPAEQNVREVIRSGKAAQVKEYKHIGFDGTTTYWNGTITPITEDGEIKYIVSKSLDITEAVMYRKKIEEQSEIIKQQNKQLETIIQNISDGLIFMDKHSNFILNNDVARRMYPHLCTSTTPADAHDNFQYCDLKNNPIDEENLPTTRAFRGETIRNERILIKKPDKLLYVEINAIPILDTESNLNAVCILHRDITQEVEMQGLIETQKQQLETIIQSLSDGIIIGDINSATLSFLNSAVSHFFADTENIKTFGNLVSYNKCFYGVDGEEIPTEDLPGYRVINKGKYNDYRLTVVQPDKKIYVSVNGSPIYNSDGKMTSVVLCIRDITQQVIQEKLIKEHDNRILKAEKEKNDVLENAIKMKDEFLATVTHEFKTPLTVINAALQTIESLYGNQLTDKIKIYLQRIRMNSFRQLRLVNNLLDITRYNAGHLKINKKNLDIVFLTNAIVKSVDLYAKQKGVMLKFSTENKYKEIAIDEEKYERILLNLLSNAIKFTPKGKSIYVHISCKNRKVIIIVKDEGVGIPKTKQKLIFERFGQVDSSLTRQAEGTGIGLSIVKTLVEGMNGTISVDSEVGSGSVFMVSLPITKLRHKAQEIKSIDSSNSRVMQATAIEFSDLYLE